MTTDQPSIVGFVPARSGSKRVPGKNIRRLGGHPLMAYAISSALDSGVFADVIVSTDSDQFADIARHYGASVPFLRPPEYAADRSPDAEWVVYTLQRLGDEGRRYDCFSILRPTSPFRRADTIQRAWKQFREAAGVDSLRAVEKCEQHPGKMWVVRGGRMVPLMPLWPSGQVWHSMQYPSLPEVYVQNASLEIAWSRVALQGGTIAGDALIPFITDATEGLDINGPQDWFYLEHLVATGEAVLPPVNRPPYPETT